jgi:DNA-binding CsgD family transcriptional regulator
VRTRGLRHRGPALAAIEEYAARLSAGQPVAVVIQGDRGSGKSVLLAAMLDRCAAAAELRARCHAAEGSFAFGVAGQLLERLPAIDLDALTGAEGPTQEYRLFDRCYRAVRELATQGPVVLAVDDVHLADALSARWLSYLARRLHALPIGLVVTASPGSSAPRKSADELLAGLKELAHGNVICCDPLCPQCAGELIAGELGHPVDPVLARRCQALTRGNPYLLSLVASQLGAAPALGADAALDIAGRAVACTLLGWLRQDDPVKAKVAEQFAVSGSGTLETAAMLTGQGEEVAREARATFCDVGLFAPEPPDTFVHPVFGDAITSAVRPQERAVMHAHAARMFARIGESATLAAEHAMLAGTIGEPWVRLVLRQAARQAAAAGDWLRGASYLNRALLEPGPSGQTVAITAELSSLEFHRDIGACLRQVAAVLAFDAAGLGADAALAVVADPALAVEDGDVAAAFCDAIASLATRGEPERSALLRLAAPALLCGHPHSPAQVAGIRQAIRGLASGPADMAARQLLSALALSTAARGRHPGRCKALALRAAAGGRAGYTDPVHSTVAGAALALVWAGDLNKAADICAQALETAQRMASPTGEGLALFARSEIAFQRGNLTAALNDAHQAVQLFQLIGAGTLEAAAAAALIRVRLTRGEAGLVPAQVATGAPRASGHPFVLAMRQETNGMIAAAQANHALALRQFLEAGRQLMAAGMVNPGCSSWRSRAVGQLVALGQVWEARTLAQAEMALARSWGSPGPLGRALIAAAAAYEGADRRALLAEAVSVLEDSGCRLQLARALIGLGSETGTDTAGPGRAASDMLERGLSLAEACGAVALAATAQRAMHANGTRPRGHLASTELTSAERRVADLVMTGMSNQDVADKLTLSKRTIDTHLGRIYRKLGITGRDRLNEAISSPPIMHTGI